MAGPKHFISYAHEDDRLVASFEKLLRPHLSIAQGGGHEIWSDKLIPVGTDWDGTIKKELADCQAGILLGSPSFFASSYIRSVEIASFLEQGKMIFPVALRVLDFKNHNMATLDAKQFYFLKKTTLAQPKAFAECAGHQREEFVFGLFQQIMKRST